MIAFVLSSAEGGVRKHCLELLAHNRLLRHNCSLVVYPVNQTDQIFLNRNKGSYGWESLVIEKKIGFRDIYNILLILFFLYRDRINVAHAHGAKAGLYLRVSKIFKWNLKVIYSPHGGAFHKENQGRLRFVILILERLLDKLTSQLIFESNYARQLYIENIKGSRAKYKVIYNAVCVEPDVDTKSYIRDEILEKKRKGCKVITVVARVREVKGQDILLKAIKKLDSKVHVYLVGAQDEAFIKTLMPDLDSSNCSLWGDELNVEDFYIYSDLIIAPSRAESFGYVPVEAGLYNCRMIVSDIPAFQETLSGCRGIHYFTSGNVESLKEKICLALSDESEIDYAPIKNRFCRNVMINNFEEVYKGLVG